MFEENILADFLQTENALEIELKICAGQPCKRFTQRRAIKIINAAKSNISNLAVSQMTVLNNRVQALIHCYNKQNLQR